MNGFRTRLSRLEAARLDPRAVIAFVNSSWDADVRDERVRTALAERGLEGRPISLFQIHNQREIELVSDQKLQDVLDQIACNAGLRIGMER